MKDPVTGFTYPEQWVRACTEPDRLPGVEQGFFVLTASGSVLRRGFTTGTTAAAACKAAVLSLAGEVDEVSVTLPCGLSATLPAKAWKGVASCWKDAGDYREDVTAGLEITAHAAASSSGIQIVPGEGIGSFARDTPRFRKGTPAISPPALDCIRQAVEEAMAEADIPGVTVILAIPRGAALAHRTLNPRIGVTGGISILGTTGLVEPWDDHLTESVIDRIERAEKVVLTTGRTGLRFSRRLFPEHEAVLVGGRIGEALDAARGEVVLCGLPGLILRFIDPDILDGTGRGTVEDLAASSCWRERAEAALAAFRERYPGIRAVLVNREGEIIGDSG
ncbi:MAG: cobalt-precorrin-5B (C(1))-methyltransferase [Methanomicrobiaceae archaeon]|nr:cobalt-precorrin-5B (C(1))-methyltransferase [Methanomicrobiaceae archaeon]